MQAGTRLQTKSIQGSLKLPCTVAPSSAGCSTFHSHFTSISFTLKLVRTSIMSEAMRSKSVVASAKMVGPAPERQMPSKPGWDFGDTVSRTLVSPGIRDFLKGWWTLSLIAS